MCCGITSIISCAQGYTYDGRNCVYTSSGGSSYNCNIGFTWNGVSCVPGVGSNCDSGFYWNGQKCILLVNNNGSLSGVPGAATYPICSAGSYWHPASSMCITGTTGSGPNGCQSSTIWNGVGCSAAGGYHQCDSGSYWTGSNCARMQIKIQTTCSSSQYWNGNGCQNMQGVGVQSCASGSYYYKPYSNCLKQVWCISKPIL